ncbi:tRNA 2-thiouridine(34) synthase MnmA [Candidatus Parcubacteria bacterium]|nr:tRNA 2-thiouridine(34) synthase MnmA [Candidatus Parcubacteria bacterium]
MSQISRSISSPKKVFVGLSGGVDSAVSAALLKTQGYDVTGVFIKVWQPDFLPCTWREERRDAMRVAAHLKIPFLFFDFEEEYKKGVADYMIEEYKRGRTPNPDVMCNREIKFGAFWKKAREMGADYIATGHYAKIVRKTSDQFSLHESDDKEKDQSYFLWTLTQEDLSHTLFPVGGYEKSEVRKLAHKFDLPVAEKKDSQGICFLGQVDLEVFLSHYISTKHGQVLNTLGEVIGTHNGALLYTLGERHGFEIFEKNSKRKPHYIISKDIERNTITVSDNPEEINSASPTSVRLEKLNWVSKLEPDTKDLEARIRYRQERFPIQVKGDKVIFKDPHTAAPGQSLVFYAGEECLGGGVIDN